MLHARYGNDRRLAPHGFRCDGASVFLVVQSPVYSCSLKVPCPVVASPPANRSAPDSSGHALRE
eukprot:scaffold13386_cov214-Isochrysis_galbana.AAC.6